jgi:hypothetical protein
LKNRNEKRNNNNVVSKNSTNENKPEKVEEKNFGDKFSRKKLDETRLEKKEMKDITCFRCGKKGHYKNNCYAKESNGIKKTFRTTSLSRKIYNLKKSSKEEEEKSKQEIFQIELMVNDKNVMFLLDTGSTSSFISERELPENLIPCESTQFSSINGITTTCEGFKMRINKVEEVLYKIKGNESILGLHLFDKLNLKIKDFIQNYPSEVTFKIGNLTEDERKFVKENLEENIKRNLETEPEFIPTKICSTHIPVNPDNMIYIKQYKIPIMYESFVEEKLEEYLQRKIIFKPFDNLEITAEERRNYMGINSPIMVTGEKKLRLCFDGKALNARVDPSFASRSNGAIPTIEDILLHCRGKFYVKLDLMRAYLKLKLDESSKVLTAFTYKNTKYAFNVSIFGLSFLVGQFCSLIGSIINGVKNVYHYVDDIIISGQNVEEIVETTKVVLDKLTAANLTINMEKCVFVTPNIEILGYKLEGESLRYNVEQYRFLDDLDHKEIKTYSQLKHFLGIVTWLRKFIINASIGSSCLDKVAKGDEDIEWTQERIDSFVYLKEAIKENLILVKYDKEKELFLATDSSRKGVAGTFS